MAITIKKDGFGQVEPNHLSATRSGQIYAQLPAAAALGDTLEQGRFAKYDVASGEVNLTGSGEWLMIYNEEKLYDERKQMHKDYAMQAKYSVDGKMVPRLFRVEAGDLFTTNTIKGAEAENGVAVAKGNQLAVDATGYLAVVESNGDFEVVKETTMPDGQKGVQVKKIK